VTIQKVENVQKSAQMNGPSGDGVAKNKLNLVTTSGQPAVS
jgi:hypothetical protein